MAARLFGYDDDKHTMGVRAHHAVSVLFQQMVRQKMQRVISHLAVNTTQMLKKMPSKTGQNNSHYH
eukprot:532120-Amphidinium_carterae.1